VLGVKGVKWRWLLVPLGLASLVPLYWVGLLGWMYLAPMLIPRPRAAEIDRVERALAPIACIGPLDQWDRTYFYGVSDARRGTATSPAARDRNRIALAATLGLPPETRIVSELPRVRVWALALIDLHLDASWSFGFDRARTRAARAQGGNPFALEPAVGLRFPYPLSDRRRGMPTGGPEGATNWASTHRGLS